MKILLLATLLTCKTLIATDLNTTQPLTAKQEGIKYIKMLGKALKKELQAKMMADMSGIQALEFCTRKASEITQNINTKLPAYAKVRRTALKVRNDVNNTADTLDTQVMQAYVTSIAEKTFTPKDIKVVKEGNITRVYKPLLTLPVCLKCHGTHVSPALKERIKSAYPNDKAMDFKIGTLRGVIVAEIEKH